MAIESSSCSIAMANYLMLLSRSSGGSALGSARVFECKTCNRKFPSFQALGGHRASHKKLKPGGSPVVGDHLDQTGQINASKPKMHECSICGLEFAIGQALGGHMRRHRVALNGSHPPSSSSSSPLSLSLSLATSTPPSDRAASDDDHNGKLSGESKRRRTSSSGGYNIDQKRPCLDLNLTPLENGVLEIPPVLC